MSENKTTYESLDDKVAPEALLKDTRGKHQMVDGHGIKQEADYDDPDKLYGMLIARIQKPSVDSAPEFVKNTLSNFVAFLTHSAASIVSTVLK